VWSRPPRGAWIETITTLITFSAAPSRPPRGAWIETVNFRHTSLTQPYAVRTPESPRRLCEKNSRTQPSPNHCPTSALLYSTYITYRDKN
jgi:hypothetical protein